MQNMGTYLIENPELYEAAQRIILAAKGRKKHAAFCAVFEGIRDIRIRGFEDGLRFMHDKIIECANQTYPRADT